MRARLDANPRGYRFRFLCDTKMASRMGPVIIEAHGRIVEEDVRSYGVVFLVEKV